MFCIAKQGLNIELEHTAALSDWSECRGLKCILLVPYLRRLDSVVVKAQNLCSLHEISYLM